MSDKVFMTMFVLFNVVMFILGLLFNNFAFIGALLPIDLLIAASIEPKN